MLGDTFLLDVSHMIVVVDLKQSLTVKCNFFSPENKSYLNIKAFFCM